MNCQMFSTGLSSGDFGGKQERDVVRDGKLLRDRDAGPWPRCRTRAGRALHLFLRPDRLHRKYRPTRSSGRAELVDPALAEFGIASRVQSEQTFLDNFSASLGRGPWTTPWGSQVFFGAVSGILAAATERDPIIAQLGIPRASRRKIRIRICSGWRGSKSPILCRIDQVETFARSITS